MSDLQVKILKFRQKIQIYNLCDGNVRIKKKKKGM